MSPLPPPKRKPSEKAQDGRASLVLRLDRAANEINPFLMVLAVGLLLLNVTLFLGLSASNGHHGAAQAATYPHSEFGARPVAGTAEN